MFLFNLNINKSWTHGTATKNFGIAFHKKLNLEYRKTERVINIAKLSIHIKGKVIPIFKETQTKSISR